MIKCAEIRRLRKEFVAHLVLILVKKLGNTHEEEIISFAEDILRYIKNEEEEDYKIN